MHPRSALDTAALRLAEEVRRRHGVVRVSTLQAEGWSRHRVRMALDDGHLRRVRRDWVAVPDAEPELVAAARDAVTLTCVTQARRLGLWVLEEDRCHVAAPPHGRGGKSPRSTVHWSTPVIPRHADALTDPIENVLGLVASCQPREAAQAVWDSALQKGLVARASLERLPYGARARDLLSAATAYSDSGLETIFIPRLRWLRLRILTQVWIDGHRVDALIGDRLVLQIDGGHHVGAQRASDIAHDARLMLLGYHVIRVTYRQLMDDWPSVHDRITRAVAQGLHLAA